MDSDELLETSVTEVNPQTEIEIPPQEEEKEAPPAEQTDIPQWDDVPDTVEMGNFTVTFEEN